MTKLWPTKNRHCEIQSFLMIHLLQSSVQMSFNISLKTDVSYCWLFPSPHRGIWPPPHFFSRKPHHWTVRIERCTSSKGKKCRISIFFSLYFCTIKMMREKDAQGSEAHRHFASDLRDAVFQYSSICGQKIKKDQKFDASTLCIRYTRRCVPILLQDQRPSLVGVSITQLQGRSRIF